MSYDIVGMGNALVDIMVKVDDDFIEGLAVSKGGMSLSTSENQSRILDALADHSRKISSGGSAANTIHGIGVLGGKTYYLGRVANDAYGRHYSEDMKICGVGFPGSGAETAGTGTSVVLITPDSQRTMITHLGVSSTLHPDNVDETIINAAKMVYIEGYLWMEDESMAAALKMTKIARKEGVLVAFTLSDKIVIDMFKDGLADFIRWNVDILFCNETEAHALAGTTDTEAAFTELQGMADKLFLTLGSKGALVGQAGRDKVYVKVFPVDVVDTTGAGDLYAAGVLYGLLKEHSLEEAAIIGSYCASQVVTHLGARMPLHAHTDIQKILTQYRILGK